MIRRKTKSYSIRGEKIYRILKQTLKHQIKNGEIEDMPIDTKFIQSVIEDCNKQVAKKLLEHSEIALPYIGKIVIVNKERNIKQIGRNLPISGTLSKQYNTKIFIDMPRLIGIKFEPYRLQHPYARIMGFRLNRQLFNDIKNYILDNNIPLYGVKKYEKCS